MIEYRLPHHSKEYPSKEKHSKCPKERASDRILRCKIIDAKGA